MIKKQGHWHLPIGTYSGTPWNIAKGTPLPRILRATTYDVLVVALQGCDDKMARLVLL